VHSEVKTIRDGENAVDLRASSYCVLTRRRQLYDGKISKHADFGCRST
jgi:hypothetical protein